MNVEFMTLAVSFTTSYAFIVVVAMTVAKMTSSRTMTPRLLLRRCHLHRLQLIAHGFWEWAIFVYMHLDDDAVREMAVRDVLLRHAHEKNTFAMDDGALNLDREEFLCGSTDGRWGLGLPKDLLNEALAYWKGYEPFTPPVPKSCQVEDHACLLTAAGQTTDESRKEMAEDLLAMQWVARKTLGAEPPAAQLRTLTEVFGSSGPSSTVYMHAYHNYLKKTTGSPEVHRIALDKLEATFARGRVFEGSVKCSSETYIATHVSAQEQEEIVRQEMMDWVLKLKAALNIAAASGLGMAPSFTDARADGDVRREEEGARRLRLAEATKAFVQAL